MRMPRVRTQLDRFSLSRMSFKRGHNNLSYTYADFFYRKGSNRYVERKRTLSELGKSRTLDQRIRYPAGLWVCGIYFVFGVLGIGPRVNVLNG